MSAPRKRRLTPRKQAAEASWNAAGRTTWVTQRRERLEAAAQAGGWGSLAELLADPAVNHGDVARMLGVSYQYVWRLRRPYQAEHQRRTRNPRNPHGNPGARPAPTAESYAQELRALRDAGSNQHLSLSLATAHHAAGWTLQALGDILGVSREAVRLRIARALRSIPPPES